MRGIWVSTVRYVLHITQIIELTQPVTPTLAAVGLGEQTCGPVC